MNTFSPKEIALQNGIGGGLSMKTFSGEKTSMMEARYMISDAETVEKKIRPALAAAGAVFKKWYALTDIVYLPRGVPPDLANFRYVRWRIAHATGQDRPVITVVDKKTTWHGGVKQDYILVRREFDAVPPSVYFIEQSYDGWEKKVAFSRTGMEYRLGNLPIFIENILAPGVRWSAEIEGSDEQEIAAFAQLLGLVEPIRDSVPELVQKTSIVK